MAGQDAVEGTHFGSHRLVERLGRGGMGEVWRAYDTASITEPIADPVAMADVPWDPVADPP